MSELTDPNEPDVARLSRMVLAGEDVAELVDLVRALNRELAPRTHLERRQVEHIALTEFEIDRRRRRVPEVEAKMMQEIYEQVVRRGMPPASPEALTYVHPNLAAEAFLRAEDTFNDLDTGIWRLERRRADLLRQYRDLVAVRRASAVEDAEVTPG